MMEALDPKKDPMSKLVFELSKLPGVGGKTAARLAYYILKQEQDYAKSLASAVLNAKTLTQFCSQCFNWTDQDPCRICTASQVGKRDAKVICVVEKPSDVFPIEQVGNFNGVFHVLHGVLSPMEGIGPEELRIRELLNRLEEPTSETGDTIEEVILATNPSVEGDATALYLTKMIKNFQIKVTKLAHGIPVGGQLEYTDRQTLSRALENRTEIS